METKERTHQEYQSRLSVSEAVSLLENHEAFPYIVIDTETNGGDVRDGTGVCYGLSLCTRLPGLGLVAYYFPAHHPAGGGYPAVNLELDQLAQLREAIQNYKGVLVFHNAKFDLESLRTIGIDYKGKYLCTMLMCHLINENLPYSKSLQDCGRYYLNDAGKKNEGEYAIHLAMFGYAGMPYQSTKEYGEYDAVLTYALLEKILPLFWAEVEKQYWDHKAKFTTVVRAMERRGVRIDVPMCERMAVHGEMIMGDIVELLDGRNPGSSKDLEQLLIKELGLPIVKPTKGTRKLAPEEWKPSFDKEAMEIYDRMLESRGENNILAQYILTYRGWQKAVSSNYKPYVELLSFDGRLRPNYKLHGTKTGRMSCEKPNLQQIPRAGDKPWNGEMKTAFLPADGYSLWEFDYGQLELRLATAYADERELKAVFAAGRDVFTEMSASLGMLRHDTKTLTYTIQYGGGLTRISAVFGVTVERADSIRSGFYTTYPGFREKSNLASKKAKYVGKIKLWSGRYRHFMYPKDEAHKAFNSVIQGGAADIVEGTMVRLFEQVDNEEECRMLLAVHDSVIFEIKEGMEDYYIPKIKEIMENVEPDFGVKFAVDAHKFGAKD